MCSFGPFALWAVGCTLLLVCASRSFRYMELILVSNSFPIYTFRFTIIWIWIGIIILVICIRVSERHLHLHNVVCLLCSYSSGLCRASACSAPTWVRVLSLINLPQKNYTSRINERNYKMKYLHPTAPAPHIQSNHLPRNDLNFSPVSLSQGLLAYLSCPHL